MSELVTCAVSCLLEGSVHWHICYVTGFWDSVFFGGREGGHPPPWYLLRYFLHNIIFWHCVFFR